MNIQQLKEELKTIEFSEESKLKIDKLLDQAESEGLTEATKTEIIGLVEADAAVDREDADFLSELVWNMKNYISGVENTIESAEEDLADEEI